MSIFFLRRQTKPTFYATVLSHSFTSELPELDFVRIVGEGGEPVLPGVEGVDIAKADLHKFTNSAGACLSFFFVFYQYTSAVRVYVSLFDQYTSTHTNSRK